MKPVYLLCGVPGSGKTWVMNLLAGHYTCIQNDLHIGEPRYKLVMKVKSSAMHSTKPVIVDCPFAEREFRNQLGEAGVDVIPLFIVETPDTVARRYKNREGKEASKSILTRANTIVERAIEWDAKFGTSEGILKYLVAEADI